MPKCDDCPNDLTGLMAIIPNEDWRAISKAGDLNGQLCPWCMSARLVAIGRADVHCELHLVLPGLSAVNLAALEHAGEIERLRWMERQPAD
jgi:hypothetical protein